VKRQLAKLRQPRVWLDEVAGSMTSGRNSTTCLQLGQHFVSPCAMHRPRRWMGLIVFILDTDHIGFVQRRSTRNMQT